MRAQEGRARPEGGQEDNGAGTSGIIKMETRGRGGSGRVLGAGWAVRE